MAEVILQSDTSTSHSGEACCEICKKKLSDTALNRYTFWYGREIGKETQMGGTYKTVTTKYSIGGQYTGIICEECVRKRMALYIRLMAILSVPFIVGAIVSIFKTYGTNSNGAPIVIGAVAAFFIYLAVSKRKAIERRDFGDTGSKLLIKANKYRIHKLGYNEMWTPGQYAYLQKR